MSRLESPMDITKNIKTIENLKCDLLSSVSDLNRCLLVGDRDSGKRAEHLSKIVLYAYILSQRLGVDFEQLESRIVNKIRLGVLDDTNLYKEDFVGLLKLFDIE